MRAILKRTSETNRKIIRQNIILLFLFATLLGSTPYAIAQEDSSLTSQEDSTTTTSSSSENAPSFQNLKKTGAAMTEEMKKIKESQAHEELMEYVYMVLGFSLVIAIAWFSVSAANKSKKRDDENKRAFLENKAANQTKSGHKAPQRGRNRR